MLEAITGCMYSGKTTEFIELVKQLRKDGKQVVALKPTRDSRYSKHNIVTHNGIQLKGISIDDISEIWDLIDENTDVIAIDEVQFFEDWDTPKILNDIANKGIHVVVAGLDTDFKGEPYGIMSELLAYADMVIKKSAECSVCGEDATRSQRLVYGEPVKRSDKLFYEHPHMSYEARCRNHHIVIDD